MVVNVVVLAGALLLIGILAQRMQDEDAQAKQAPVLIPVETDEERRRR